MGEGSACCANVTVGAPAPKANSSSTTTFRTLTQRQLRKRRYGFENVHEHVHVLVIPFNLCIQLNYTFRSRVHVRVRVHKRPLPFGSAALRITTGETLYTPLRELQITRALRTRSDERFARVVIEAHRLLLCCLGLRYDVSRSRG